MYTFYRVWVATNIIKYSEAKASASKSIFRDKWELHSKIFYFSSFFLSCFRYIFFVNVLFFFFFLLSVLFSFSSFFSLFNRLRSHTYALLVYTNQFSCLFLLYSSLRGFESAIFYSTQFYLSPNKSSILNHSYTPNKRACYFTFHFV